MELIKKFECIQIIINASGFDDVELIEYKITNASDCIVGFLGQYFKLTAIVRNVNSNHEEYTFFVKSLPIHNIPQKEVIESIGVFKKEINLYKMLFKEMEPYCTLKWHANFYMSRPDILVLEDLFKSGYNHIEDGETFTIDHLKVALKSFAAMHANSIVYEIKTGINIGKKFDEHLFEPSVEPDCSWFLAGLKGIKTVASLHSKFQTPEYQKFISAELIPTIKPIYEMIKTSNNFLNVFCHRDAWEKNIFFKYDSNDEHRKPIGCVLVDFQISRYQPPAIDVLFFLHLNMKQKLRDALLENLLHFYYNNLEKATAEMEINLNELLTWNDFIKSCEYFKLVAFVLNGIYAPLIYLPKGLLLDLQRHNVNKYHHYMECNRDELILNVIENDEVYKTNVFDVIQELVEFVYENKNKLNNL